MHLMVRLLKFRSLKLLFLSGILFGFIVPAFPQIQQNTTTPNGINVFYHPNGKIASEGLMRDGKPDGYWKTYNEQGILKSEGNRKNFELDSLWKFYDDTSRLILSIEYKNGRKNGLKTTFRPGEVVAETFIDDIKQGPTTYYYPDGKVRMVVQFVDGLETGVAKEYAPDGSVITYIEYKKGFMVSRERINHKDKNGLKQGRWKFFWDNGLVKIEGTYKDDKKNGYFKEYDENGGLLTVQKFANDIEQKEAPELTSLKLKTDYYPTGKVKTVASYNGDVPEGVRREYAEDGKITSGYIFKGGKMVGEGIIDEEGIKDGPWKEYYPDGILRSTGTYDKGKPIGDWKFFFENGHLEQEGKYNKKGSYDGVWRWYFEEGQVRREQTFLAGQQDGPYVEYDTTGKEIVKGSYSEDLEEGEWVYDYDDFKETGTYRGGMRNGKWKSYYAGGVLRFEGEYIDDNLNGHVTWYWPTGKKKDDGSHVNGSREGEWTTYDEDGNPFLVITYKGDIEKRYDGYVIKPPFEE
jgi:uncharacterized protein